MLDSVRKLLKKLNPFGVDETDPFNQALHHYRQIRYCLGDEAQCKYHISQMIRHSQLAIQKNRYDRGAHVLLANGYCLAASRGAPDGYKFCMQCAAAAIHEWKTNRMFTRQKNVSIGREMYGSILAETQGRRGLAKLRGISFAGMAQIHQRHYHQAIDPGSLNEVAKFLLPSDDASSTRAGRGNQ